MRERGGSEESCILLLTSLPFPLPTWFRPVLYYLNDYHWARAGVHMSLLSVFREGLTPCFVEKMSSPVDVQLAQLGAMSIFSACSHCSQPVRLRAPLS